MNTEQSAPFVIVVDDDIDMRNALQPLLAAYGFECIALADGESLVPAVIKQEAYCLVIDIFLPGCSGIEAYREMRGHGPSPPVVFITAHDDPNSREAARSFGGEFLLKPFTGRQLIAAIYRVVSKRTAD